MNAKPFSVERCHGGQPEGVKGQKAVAPNFLDRLFHQRQAQLKSTPTAVIRAESSRPLFQPEFTGLTHKTNKQRLAEYERKLAHIEEIAA